MQSVPTHIKINTSSVEAKVISVLDADMIKVVAYPWPGIKCNAIIKLSGINSFSIKNIDQKVRSKAEESVKFISNLFKDQKLVRITNMKLSGISSKVLAEVITYDGINLGSELVKMGFTEPYFR